MLTQSRTQAKLTRWTEILLSCDRFGFLTTSQIQRLHDLGGARNTTRILNDMREYLASYRDGETVWYLNAAGRREIGSQTQRKRTLHTGHAIMRNEVYVVCRPESWREEYAVKWDDKQIVADALFRNAAGAYTFLEVDRTQPMAANEKKITLYRELHDSGRWQAKNGPFPTLMYVTVSEYRRERLKALTTGMNVEIISFIDLK